jgi:hypothetical protein
MADQSRRKPDGPSAPKSLLEWSFGDALEAMMEMDGSPEIPERDKGRETDRETGTRPAATGQAKASARKTTSGRRTAPGKGTSTRG